MGARRPPLRDPAGVTWSGIRLVRVSVLPSPSSERDQCGYIECVWLQWWWRILIQAEDKALAANLVRAPKPRGPEPHLEPISRGGQRFIQSCSVILRR